MACRNFVELAKSGYFDGLLVFVRAAPSAGRCSPRSVTAHAFPRAQRVVKGMLCQTGDPNGTAALVHAAALAMVIDRRRDGHGASHRGWHGGLFNIWPQVPG